jgi:Bacterial membrane protein YfhO
MSERTEAPPSPDALTSSESSEEPTEATTPASPATPRRRRLPGALTSVSMIAAVFFILAGIGTPLLGTSVFAATDELSTRSPYFDSGLAGTQVQNTYMDDTYDAMLPNTMLYVDSLREGTSAQWNPYIAGGTPLGSIPSYALFSPLSIPSYILPSWLAPAYVKLLELAVALLGAYLFLRRLSLSKPAALLGGLVFTSSAFMIMWTNWPQTRVAAMIPWLFWAAERLVQRRRLTDVALLALPVAFMLLAGFPAVTALSMMTAGVYFLVRVFAQYFGQWRKLIGVTLGAVGGIAAGVGLSAFQLLPFAKFYQNWLIEGRSQTPSDHLGLPELTTAIAPHAMGGLNSADPPVWYLPHNGRNMVEAMSYVGAGAVVLIVIAIALARSGRSMLPRGAWWALTGMSLGWIALIYLPGPLAIVHKLPVFSSNYIGRARCVLGMLLAVLAAVGFELLLRNRKRVFASLRAARLRLVYGGVVMLAACAALVVVWLAGRDAARDMDLRAGYGLISRLAHLDREMLIGSALVAAAVVAAFLIYTAAGRGTRGWRFTRFGAATVLLAIIAGQSFTLANSYWPRVDKDTFYPETDVHAFLGDNLGSDRFAGTTHAMVMGADSAKKLRALTGHTFIDKDFATLVRGMPGNPIPYPTHLNLVALPEVVANPVLDRLAVRYFVTAPFDRVFGDQRVDRGDGSTAPMPDETRISLPVPGAGPVRAVGFVPASAFPGHVDPRWSVDVTVTDESGETVATARRKTRGLGADIPFMIPVNAEHVAADAKLTANFTLHTGDDLTVRARDGQPVASSVGVADDGLRLAHAGSSVVWERTTALPRIRWASTAVSEADEVRRVAMLTSGAVGEDEVLLNQEAGSAAGEPADVEVVEDGNDVVKATVDAQGAGYLVVADADQVGWEATIDDEPAELVPADQGVIAVEVPEGKHTVALRFAAPYNNAGLWLSLFTVVVLIGLVVVDLYLGRHRARDASSEPTPTEPTPTA